MGSSTPDGEQYTRTERVQCIPIGCRALTNKHNRGTLSLAARRMSLGGARGAVAAGWTVCGACGCDGSWGIGVDRCATRAMPRGVSAWVAVCAGAMAAPPRPPPRRVDRGACGATQSVGHQRGSRCVWGRWAPHRPPPRRADCSACGGRRERGASTWILAQLVRQ